MISGKLLQIEKTKDGCQLFEFDPFTRWRG